MARKVALQVYAVKNYCIVTDYDDVSLVVHNSFCTGMGEFLMDFPDSIGIRLGLTEKSTNRRIEFTFDEISLCQINAVDTGATDIYEVRDALAPYFFSVGNGGYTFSTIVELTPTQLTTEFSIAGIELLPALGAGLYPDFEMDLVNRGDGTEAYDEGNVMEVKIGTLVLARITEVVLTTAGPTALAVPCVRPSQLQGVNARFQAIEPNQPLMLNTISNLDFTLANVANGSRVYAEIRYNIKSILP